MAGNRKGSQWLVIGEAHRGWKKEALTGAGNRRGLQGLEIRGAHRGWEYEGLKGALGIGGAHHLI